MPTDEELDAMARKLFGVNGYVNIAHDSQERIEVMQLAIAAKHAKAVCALAEDSAKYMARIVM